jgi:hypothetical protein
MRDAKQSLLNTLSRRAVVKKTVTEAKRTVGAKSETGTLPGAAPAHPLTGDPDFETKWEEYDGHLAECHNAERAQYVADRKLIDASGVEDALAGVSTKPRRTAKAPPPQPTFNGVPPGDVLESLFSDAITSAHAAVDVACEGSSNLSPAKAIKVACYISTMEANRILTKLEGHSLKTLRVRHRGVLKVWPTAVTRMTQAVAAYEADETEENSVQMAQTVLGFVDISHKVMSDKTKKKARDEFIAAYLEG